MKKMNESDTFGIYRRYVIVIESWCLNLEMLDGRKMDESIEVQAEILHKTIHGSATYMYLYKNSCSPVACLLAFVCVSWITC